MIDVFLPSPPPPLHYRIHPATSFTSMALVPGKNVYDDHYCESSRSRYVNPLDDLLACLKGHARTPLSERDPRDKLTAPHRGS